VQHDLKTNSLTGLLVASVIMLLWIGSLEYLFFIDIVQLTPLWILPAIIGRTFIQTGLFIVAHDAIHGAVFPGDRRLNHGIGRLAVMLYAFLSYKKLSLNHWQLIGILVRWVIPTFTMEFTAISLSGI
jgi:beta-carotene/zeaxanthin 4-ketolase